jgi:hypothetical protein
MYHQCDSKREIWKKGQEKKVGNTKEKGRGTKKETENKRVKYQQKEKKKVERAHDDYIKI